MSNLRKDTLESANRREKPLMVQRYLQTILSFLYLTLFPTKIEDVKSSMNLSTCRQSASIDSISDCASLYVISFFHCVLN